MMAYSPAACAFYRALPSSPSALLSEHHVQHQFNIARIKTHAAIQTRPEGKVTLTSCVHCDTLEEAL